MTSQNWRGARLLPPPPLRPGPRSPGPAQSARRSQSEGGKRTSRRGGGAGWRPGEARARSGPDWAEPPRAGELGGAEGRERAEGCGRQPRPTAACALLDPVRILVPRRRVGRGAVEAAKGRARVGSDRGWRASVGRNRRGPRALPGWLSARGTSASARRCHARPRVAAPVCEVCGSGRRAEPAGPEDAARPWAQRAGCTERPRGARPVSRSPRPEAGWPPGRQGGFVWFLLLPSPFSPLRSLLPPCPFTGLLRDLAPPPLPPPRHRLL